MSAPQAQQTFSFLVSAFRAGNLRAADGLMEQLYPELRRIACAKMKGERSNHTWQPTALVNELYLELLKAKALDHEEKPRPDDRQAFLGLAAHMMRRLLIHHARPLAKRVEKVSIDEQASPLPIAADNLQELETLLASLAQIDPDLRVVVEMKVFEGVSLMEIAHQLGCSPRTIERRWQFARHWLRRELSKS